MGNKKDIKNNNLLLGASVYVFKILSESRYDIDRYYINILRCKPMFFSKQRSLLKTVETSYIPANSLL